LEAMTEDMWVRRHISWRGELREGEHITARKHWNASWARRIHEGDYVIAYTKNPNDGGVPRAIIRLTHAPDKESGDTAWIVRFEVVEIIISELDPVTGHHKFVGSGAACETCGNTLESDWHRRS